MVGTGGDITALLSRSSRGQSGVGAMKIAIAGVMLIAVSVFAGPAQARLTPFDGISRTAADVAQDMAPDWRRASARLKRGDVQSPPAPTATLGKAGRCTMSNVVFSKIRLAQACR
jgi:hypothetical protein